MINSVHNPLIKKINKIIKFGFDNENNEFITEGRKLVFDIIKQFPELVRRIIVSESFLEKHSNFNFTENVLDILSDKLYKKISNLSTPEGIMCIGQIPEKIMKNDYKQGIFLFDVQIPQNMGTILRTAENLGFNNVIYSEKSSNPFSYKTFKNSQGAPLYLNLEKVKSDNIHSFINEKKLSGYKFICADINGTCIDDNIKKSLYKYIIVMGNEGHGLPDSIIDLCDLSVKINQIGKIESMNVAVAAGIIMHHFKKTESI